MSGKKKTDWTPTHPDKFYWPHAGYTKGDLLGYYDTVSAYLLPFLKDRPIVMKRFPEGITGQSFFQKNFVDSHKPDFVKITSIPAKTIKKNVHYIVCENKETLLFMGNLGAIELHPWDSRLRHLNKPDCMIFDLDPGPKTEFGDVIEVARAVKNILAARKIRSFVKTSGKRGLHVYVPLRPNYSYERVRAFAHGIAGEIAVQLPDLATLEKHPAKRKDKIFIDYLRNAFGQTAIAPYCPRATKEATVSTPLSWSEVKQGLDPKRLTIATIPKRLKTTGDPWKAMFKVRNTLT